MNGKIARNQVVVGGPNSRNRAETLYAIIDSPLDRMLIAATVHGVCALFMDSDDQPLRAALRQIFPDARQSGDLEALWVNPVLRHIQVGTPADAIPVDAVGSGFQHRVWAALRKIPYGEVRTYAEVARWLGHPGAYRAVARACATNPVSVVVPCHRVIRTDGALAGYRWGLGRKRALLTIEKEYSSGAQAFTLKAS
jgi:AraC family transcriptional regulator of adaptative response/methylated-DNA-[protein]-cysteine methyltransferase